MTTYVIRNGECVEKGQAQAADHHYVISDTMEHTWHPVTGKYVSSKSKFRQMTKDAGCTEVGNETKALLNRGKPPQLSRQERAQDIKRAIDQLRGR